MAYYRVWEKAKAHGEAYWLAAPTPADARRLVALNCEAAHDAEQPSFGCELSSTKVPPPGTIYCRHGEPMNVLDGARVGFGRSCADPTGDCGPAAEHSFPIGRSVPYEARGASSDFGRVRAWAA